MIKNIEDLKNPNIEYEDIPYVINLREITELRENQEFKKIIMQKYKDLTKKEVKKDEAGYLSFQYLYKEPPFEIIYDEKEIDEQKVKETLDVIADIAEKGYYFDDMFSTYDLIEELSTWYEQYKEYINNYDAKKEIRQKAIAKIKNNTDKIENIMLELEGEDREKYINSLKTINVKDFFNNEIMEDILSSEELITTNEKKETYIEDEREKKARNNIEQAEKDEKEKLKSKRKIYEENETRKARENFRKQISMNGKLNNTIKPAIKKIDKNTKNVDKEYGE